VEAIGAHDCAGEPVDGCRAAEPARVTVVRDGAERTFAITPVYDAERNRPRLGFEFASIPHPPAGPLRAVELSLDTMWTVTSRTVATIAQLFKAEKREELSGPVGSYELTRQAFEFGPLEAAWLLALISLSLGVINLFPFLPLDGGHIFWAVAEKVRGRAIPFGVMERAGFVGFALVIALFFIGLSNDLGRLTGEGFNFR
jgi:regulator of sigma E protease